MSSARKKSPQLGTGILKAIFVGTGILKAIFVQSEKYRRGRGMSITPVSGLKMRGGRLREGEFPAVLHRYFQELRHRVRFGVCDGQRGVLAQRWSGMETDEMGSGVGSGRLKEREGLYRRTGWSSLGQAQMSEDLVYTIREQSKIMNRMLYAILTALFGIREGRDAVRRACLNAAHGACRWYRSVERNSWVHV
jgi:hypothetical protein